MIKDSSQIASQSVEQQLVVKHLNERFNHWKNSVQDISDLFKQVLGLEKELDKILTSGIKKLDSKDQDFGQSVGNVFMPLKDYLLHRHASIESLHGQFDVQIIKRLKQLKTQLQAKSAEFTKAMAKAQSIVESARLSAKKEIARYEKEDVIRKRNINTSSVPSHLQMDPWLDTKLVWEKINLLVAEEATYQDTMSLIFKEIGLYDTQVAQELHAILVQHNLLKKQELHDLMLHVKPESNLNLDLFENFAVSHGLKNEALWKIRVQADDFKFDAPQIKVYKQSIVYRRSVIGLGWEPVLLVLTESGYLHQFEMKKEKSVVKHYKKQESERDLLSGTLHKSRETSEMDQTVLDETHKPSLRYLCLNFSISLAQPRITILPTPKKNDNFAFEITLLKRKEGITKFLSKEKDAVITQ